jgi:hypothetical protein
MPMRQHINGSNTLYLYIYLIWMCGAVWGGYQYQPQTWPNANDIIFTPQKNLNSHIWGQLIWWTIIRVHTCGLETAYQWLKPICICLWEVVWGGQPQLWHYDILSTPQVNLNSQIQISGQLGQCNGKGFPYMPLRQHTNGSNPFLNV